MRTKFGNSWVKGFDEEYLIAAGTKNKEVSQDILVVEQQVAEEDEKVLGTKEVEEVADVKAIAGGCGGFR